MKRILDVCCGSKMFWFQKNRDDTVYMDNREIEDVLCEKANNKARHSCRF